MLKSKLLTVFIAFALLITVGGVYATWSYAGSNLSDIANPTSPSIKVSINEATTSGAPGSLAITTNDLAYHISNDGSYNTVLGSTGSIVIEYTPNDGSQYQTVNLICHVTINAQSKYDSKDVFEITNTDSTDGVTLTLTKDAVGSNASAWTITNADVMLALTEAFYLNTVVKHNDFSAVVNGTHIEFDFSVDLSSPITTN